MGKHTAPPRQRKPWHWTPSRLAVAVASGLAGLILSGGAWAVASAPAATEVACPAGQGPQIMPGGTWYCRALPAPTGGSNTPTPPPSSATVEPSPSPTVTSATPTPAPSTPKPSTSSSTPPPPPPTTPAPTTPAPTTPAPSSPGGTQIRAWMTGYSGAGDDNSCGGHGGNCIAFPKSDGYPTVHNYAGGVGTYDNPITVAVAEDELKKYPPGTRFYLPYLRVFVVAEDYCGNEDNPECSERPNHLDVWTGENGSVACMNRVTGYHTVIVNPGRGYLVAPGPIDVAGCETYSDQVVMA